MGSQKSRVIGFLSVSTAAVVIALGVGLYVGGSPLTARKIRLDEQRVNDLQQISAAIDQHYNANREHVLPSTLESLRGEPNVYIPSLVDPVTNQAYLYRVTGGQTYTLCATFETETSVASRDTYGYKSIPQYAAPMSGDQVDPSIHHIGENCFERRATAWPQPQP